MSAAALLMLADSRLPAGGHAYSGGLEPAVASGRVSTLDDLVVFLRGRLRTAGLVASGLAAVACRDGSTLDDRGWALLDAEADARTPSPALRLASRRQGRALLRAGTAAWPSPVLDRLGEASPAAGPRRSIAAAPAQPETGPDRPAAPAAPAAPTAPAGGPHHPVALGAVGAAAGCDPAGVARVAAYLSISGPASAAVRLCGFDPLAVHGLLGALAPDVDAVGAEGAAAASGPLRDLPSAAAPILDLLAEAHARAEVRLFAS